MKFVLILLFVLVVSVLGNPDLEPDNPKHRAVSDKLHAKFGNNALYFRLFRPVSHGVYHAGRFVTSKNREEWERAKDQFSKFGTGRQQTHYLDEYRRRHQQNPN